MKAVLCVAVQLMFCIGTMAFVDLDDADIIAGFMVHDKDFDEIDHVYFAGKQKDEEAITFMYGSLEDGERTPLNRITYSKYYLYLTRCELHVDE
ncbi:unnamed protein product [Heligmosomoides polygyrus]|uniref:DOMON domain-containing protein n=1 Tax=Heligmosomoides polygyrus TaxID=6339 RepID=A0A183F2E4_HELPZ|nr:unnamed protein product [Heligmosomoides polygyrus]